MNSIRDLFSKRIDRRIEEVIKVDQADEETVLDELQEYVLTESIGEHFTTVYKAIADAPSEPHEGIASGYRASSAPASRRSPKSLATPSPVVWFAATRPV